MDQDFSQKMVIVVRNDLPSWQVLNAAAHASAYLGNRLGQNFSTGEHFVSKEGTRYPRNAQYAIVVLSAKPGQLAGLAEQARNSKLEFISFVREMIETTDDAEIEATLSAKNDAEIDQLAIGIFGPKEEVGQITKKFSWWK